MILKKKHLYTNIVIYVIHFVIFKETKSEITTYGDIML